LLGLTVHEWAHAWVARLQGDFTAEDRGRLSLNPIRHIDIFGTILVPILLLVSTRGRVGFGWARPVPVNPYNFKSPRRGVLWVSLAGPLSNICLATACGLIIRIAGLSVSQPLGFILASLTIINLYLAFFNLIPVPPLDGSGVVTSLLPIHLAERYEHLGRYGLLVLVALIFIGLVNVLAGVPARALYAILTGIRY